MTVRAASELGLGREAIGPGLLEDGAAGAGPGLVERLHGVEVDVPVQAVLERRRDVVRMVVRPVAVPVVVPVALVLVVAVMRHDWVGL